MLYGRVFILTTDSVVFCVVKEDERERERVFNMCMKDYRVCRETSKQMSVMYNGLRGLFWLKMLPYFKGGVVILFYIYFYPEFVTFFCQHLVHVVQ